jgi:enoyl-CoA hydratase/carnithine racemase
VRIGVIPAVIAVVCVPKLGAHNAMKLFLTGERFSGAQAVTLGLVHRAVPREKLREAVKEEINMICLGAPNAVVGEYRPLNAAASLNPVSRDTSGTQKARKLRAFSTNLQTCPISRTGWLGG